MRRSIFGRAWQGRAGWKAPGGEGLFATRTTLTPVWDERRKSTRDASFCPVSGPAYPLFVRLTLHPCHRIACPESPVYAGFGRHFYACRPANRDTLVMLTLHAVMLALHGLSCKKNFSPATPYESRELLVTSCIQRRIPPVILRNTSVGCAAVYSINRIMHPRNCPTVFPRFTTFTGVFSRLMVPQKCASFAHRFGEPTA
jgi:hypothetical protein